MATRRKTKVRSITPFLWFNDQAEEAARFYTSLFTESRIVEVSRVPGKGRKKGPAMTVTFRLAGQEFIALNGGPHFRPTPAFSMFVSCPGQREVDLLWRALTRGGKESQCGWLVDKFGVSWQIIPQQLPKLIGGPDPAGAQRALAAMMTMARIDVRALERAYHGA